MESSKKETIKNLYMYIVLLAGLFMIVIPTVDMVKIGLETWFFPLANADRYDYREIVPEPYPIKERISLDSDKPLETIELTADEQLMFERWKVDYKNWEENNKNKDYAKIQTQKSLVRDISILFGGLALFLSHGYVLRKRRKK